MSYQKQRKYVYCADGFNMSVQASKNHYCQPKANGKNVVYSRVEIGFPSEREPELDKYAEGYAIGEQRWTDTVYPYVPSQIVALIIAKHGGMVSGELPRLGFINIIPVLRKEKEEEE